MVVFDLIEKFVGHRERKLGAVLLIGIGGLSIFSMTSNLFTFLDKGLAGFPLLTIRNLLGVLLILTAVGWWKNRLG